jgi:2-haloacid dehalogenase
MRSYIFDVYGTLLDLNSATRDCAEKLGPKAASLAATWRAKQLEYSWVRSLMGAYKDFWAITEDALDFALASEPTIAPELKPLLMQGYLKLSCFPDVPATLERLWQSQNRLVILSNGTPPMLNAALCVAGIEGYFEHVISADSVQTFKTDPKVYELALTQLNDQPHEITFVSSNRWDIAGASAFGFQTCWLNRRGLPDEYADHAPDRILSLLTEI